MTYGDTGWREVGASWLLPTWTAVNFRLRRVNSTVFLYVFDLKPTNPPLAYPANLVGPAPTGFTPNSRTANVMSWRSGVSRYVAVTVEGSQGWVARDLTDPALAAHGNSSLTGAVSWATDSAWPSSLPGVTV